MCYWAIRQWLQYHNVVKCVMVLRRLDDTRPWFVNTRQWSCIETLHNFTQLSKDMKFFWNCLNVDDDAYVTFPCTSNALYVKLSWKVTVPCILRWMTQPLLIMEGSSPNQTICHRLHSSTDHSFLCHVCNSDLKRVDQVNGRLSRKSQFSSIRSCHFYISSQRILVLPKMGVRVYYCLYVVIVWLTSFGELIAPAREYGNRSVGYS